MQRLTRNAGFACVCLTAMLLFPATLLAQIGPEPKANSRQDRIVGIWDVDVAIASCAGGPAFANFKAMHKFELGGTGQVVPATNPAGLSAHMLVWNHVGGHDYRWAVKFFRFEAGVAVGYNVITGEVSINPDGTLYAGSGVAEFFDMAGNFQFSSCPSFAGTRFTG